MTPLSVLITCYNSQKTIQASLESASWADEILVVDSFSTDNTLAICKQYTERIVQHEYIGPAYQKNWAIPQCSHEWVLVMDSDEVLEPGFKEEVLRKIGGADKALDAYRVPRKNFIYGRWVRYGGIYPDYELRLFRRDKGRYITREVHERLSVPGQIGTLDSHILHNGFKDIGTWVEKMSRYTRYETQELVKQGRGFHLSRLTLFPVLVFLKTYILELGILDGYRGFLLAVINSMYYFVTYARLYEKQK